ncbi:MAG: diguanylate cyclase [Hyphomicrobiales bacterium]|nr:diguanylate cyclase [Hyphomicrobiales bacterium]
MYNIVTMLSIDRDWLLTTNLLLSVLLLLWVLRYRVLYRNSKEEADQYSKSLEELNEGFYRAEINGKLVYANPAMAKLVGLDDCDELFSSGDETANTWYVEPGRKKLFVEILKKNGFVRDFISQIRHIKTGKIIWISENAHLVGKVSEGEAAHYEGLMHNISDAVQRGKLEDRIEKLSDNLPGGLFQLQVNRNGSFSVPFTSRGFHDLTGLSKADLATPKIFLNRIHAEFRDRCAQTLSVSLETMESWTVDFKITKSDGVDCWVGVTATPERLNNGTIFLHGHISDISQRKEAEGKIAYYAYYDPLTRLPNRTFFLHHLEKSISSSSRSGIFKALLFLDIDNFKLVNDAHGHLIGDLLLKEVANRISKVVRANDTVSRLGGDEFVILLDSIGESETVANTNATTVANKIIEEFSRGFVLDGERHNCTASIGIYPFNGDNTDCEVLIKNADTAMYEAKKNGKNKIAIFIDDDCANIKNFNQVQSHPNKNAGHREMAM